MRLLVISSWYPNRVYKNDGNFVRNLSELVADVAHVTVLTVVSDSALPLGSQEATDAVEASLRVVRVYYSGDGARVQRIAARSSAWKTGLKKVGVEFDLIHAHILIDGGIIARRLSKKTGLPYLITEHASRWLRPWPTLRFTEKWLGRRAAKQACFVLPVSEALAEGMKRQGVGGRIEVLPNPVRESVFYPPRAWNDVETFTFLHVSDFTPNKRLDLLIAAFHQLWQVHPDVRLIIAGDGDLDLLAELARTMRPEFDSNTAGEAVQPQDEDPITITGPHNTESIAVLMRAADAFVLTSDYETQSIVLLEAQLTGLQAIATRCGGPDTIINDPEVGRLIQTDDGDELFEAMIRVHKVGRRTPTERQSIATRARERFGARVVKEKLLTYYQSCIDA